MLFVRAQPLVDTRPWAAVGGVAALCRTNGAALAAGAAARHLTLPLEAPAATHAAPRVAGVVGAAHCNTDMEHSVQGLLKSLLRSILDLSGVGSHGSLPPGLSATQTRHPSLPPSGHRPGGGLWDCAERRGGRGHGSHRTAISSWMQQKVSWSGDGTVHVNLCPGTAGATHRL